MPGGRPISDEDYEALEELDSEIESLRRDLKDIPVESEVQPSTFDESVDYELGLLTGNYWVNAIKSGASYKLAVTDEDGNYVDEEGTILDDPYVDAVVQISDLDRLRKEMVRVGKEFVESYVGAKLYELEEKRSEIESQYEEPDAMSIAHAAREEEMMGESIRPATIHDDNEEYVIDQLNTSALFRDGSVSTPESFIEELTELEFEVVKSGKDFIEFINPRERDIEGIDRFYGLALTRVSGSNVKVRYIGYEEV